MATYITSDIHGDYETFINMLKMVGFSESDKLVIVGDIADRCKDFYKILTFIRANKNIELLAGNHEENMKRFIKEHLIGNSNLSYKEIYERAYNLDCKYGYMLSTSIDGLAGDVGENNVYSVLCDEILPYLEKLPDHKIIEQKGKKYLLVHAGLNYDLPLEKQTRKDFTRTREPFNSLDLPYYDYIIIHGHTPTQQLTGYKGNGEVLFKNHKICIDGGASSLANGRLNMLRLEDMQVFYLKSVKRFEYPSDYEVTW